MACTLLRTVVAKAKRIYFREMFNPGLLGLFVNPYYFSRKGLYHGIWSNKDFMKGKLLDFGCGSKPYRSLMDVEEYIGLDIKDSGHNHENDSIDIYYGGEIIPFPENYFDSVFSSQVFEHVPEPTCLLKEVNRVMKHGSYFLITVPFVWDEHEIPYDFNRWTSFGIKELFTQNNFKIINMAKSTNYVETIIQLWSAYIYQHIFPKMNILKLILTILFIAPISLIGLFLSKILPQSDILYCDNILVVKKP